MAQITVTATLNDPSGTALQGNAYVRFRLRNFAGFVPVVSGTSVICETQIDALPNGSGAVSQALWPNNAITPSTTFYTVEFWDQGRITSSGNYIFNANTSLNTAAQLNAPPVPAGFSLVLQNNDVLNSSQSTLDLKSTDASVTITDLGAGKINLQSPGGVAAGSPLADLPPFGGGGGSLTGYSLVLRVPGSKLLAVGSKMKVGLAFYNLPTGTAVVGAASVGATIANPIPAISGFTYNYAWTTAPVAITWPAGSFANNSQVYFSNPVTIPIDTAHDYYVVVYIDPTNTAYTPYAASTVVPEWINLVGYLASSNHTADANASALVSLSGSNALYGIQALVTA